MASLQALCTAQDPNPMVSLPALWCRTCILCQIKRPNRMADKMSDSDGMPERMPDTMPDGMLDKMSEYMSGYMPRWGSHLFPTANLLGFNLWGQGVVTRKCTPQKNGNSPGTLLALEPLEPCPITLQPWNPGTCCWVAKLGNILFLGVAALSIRLRMWSSWLGSRLNLVTHTSTGSLSYSLAFFGILSL